MAEKCLAGKRVLVTGASGFIAKHVLRSVAEAGGEPLPVIRKSSNTKGLERWHGSLRRADLRHPESLAGILEGVDLVLHLAGLTRARSLTEFEVVNARGVRHLARACLEAQHPPQRFLLVSSLSAAGPSGSGPARQEQDAARPCSDYGRSKLAGERELQETLGQDLPWTIVRPPIVYGPGERDLLMVFRMCQRGLVPLIRAGRPRYSVVFGPDLADAIVRLAGHPDAADRVFHVCEAQDYSYAELVQQMGQAVGRQPWTPPLPVLLARLAALTGSLTQPLRRRPTLLSLSKLPEILARGWLADGSLARELLADLCPTSFACGARLTAAWYREQGWL